MAKKPIAQIGGRVPRSLKFGIIVAVAIFWAQFIRAILDEFFIPLLEVPDVAADLTVALIATIIGYLILLGYPKIQSRLRRTKV